MIGRYVEESEKNWEVKFTGKARKQQKILPKTITPMLQALRRELEQDGPEAKNWPHFGPIYGRAGYFHCHLNKGRPCYVAVWRVENNEINVIEVRYVGTHEGINYNGID